MSLKVRVIPMLIIQDGLLKKPVQFRNPRTVANPISIARVFEERQVDELILVDRGSSLYEEETDLDLVRDIAEQLYVPFAFGGGLRTVSAMRDIIQSGAERVVVNTAAVERPEFVRESATEFGSQCVVVSIDAVKTEDRYRVVTKSGTELTSLDPVTWAMEVADLGAGEIVVNSVAHEGMMHGFDIELIRSVADSVSIPVIAAGGCGVPGDFVSAVIDGHASAVAAGSIFHYTKYTPNMIKGVMRDAGIEVRTLPGEDYRIT